MTSGLYGKFLEEMLTKDATAPDFDSDVFRLSLISASYTPNFTVETLLSQVTANINSNSTHTETMGAFAISSGLLSAANITFTGAVSDTAKNILLWDFTGSATTTSKLIAFFDITDVTPNGGDITIQWDQAGTPGRVFKIGGP